MKLVKCKCKRCTKSWTPRKSPDEIVQCPRCKSLAWDKEKK